MKDQELIETVKSLTKMYEEMASDIKEIKRSLLDRQYDEYERLCRLYGEDAALRLVYG